jgi:hypothetical protein
MSLHSHQAVHRDRSPLVKQSVVRNEAKVVADVDD